MKTLIKALCALVLAGWALPALAAVEARADSRETISVGIAHTGEDRDHPLTQPLAIVVSEHYRDGAQVCASYENDVYPMPDRGVVKLQAGLWRDGDKVATIPFGRRKIRGNRADLGCRIVPPLAKGDTLLFDFRFVNPPPLAPRTFGHGNVVYTTMEVRASVESLPVAEPSTIEFLSVSPRFGSALPAGAKIKVRVAYSCTRPLGCNIAAEFDQNGRAREKVAWVRPGSRKRTLALRCHNDSRWDLTRSGLVLSIERSESNTGSTLDTEFVPGGITCLSSNPWPGNGGG